MNKSLYYESIIIALLGLLLICTSLSCGGPYKVEVKPVEVEVKHTFDLDEIKKAFETQCKNELVTYTQTELDDCTNEKLASFLDALAE